MSPFIASESANNHLIDTLNLHGNQYNLILSIFFVPYVLTAPFLGLLGKKIGPNIVLPCMMLTFGICTILVVAVFNFSGLFAIRWFLGMAESAFFPLVIYYQTTLVFPASIILSNPFFDSSSHPAFTVVENWPVDSQSSTQPKASPLPSPVYLPLAYFALKVAHWHHGGTFSSLKEAVP